MIRRKIKPKAKKPKPRKPNKDDNYDVWLQLCSVPELEKEYDRLFSLYVRQKGADHRGYAKCVTCGSTKHWREHQWGHFFSRRHKSLRWEESNTGVQCVSCNMFNQGAGPQFSIYILNTYGEAVLRLLEVKKNNTWKAGKYAYISLIKEMVQKIINIKGEIK